jgi:hypothetical protein
MNVRDAAAKIFKSAQADLDAVLGDAALTNLAKAADMMGESRMVTDSWQAGQKHSTISAEEVNTGPELSAQGDNTVRMNRIYSNNARQSGPQADAERMADALNELKATMKAALQAHGTAITALLETAKGTSALLTTLVAKAEEEDEEAAKAKAAAAAKADEPDETCTKAKSRATERLTEANTAFSKAKALIKASEEMDEDDDKAEIKSMKAKARALRKAAIIALSKARRDAYIAGDAVLKSTINEIAAKADAEFVSDEELEKAEAPVAAKAEDEDDEAAKAKAAALAKGPDTGHQADRADPASGNQAAAAVKAAEMDPTVKAAIDSLVSGMNVLQTNLHSVLDMVARTSKTPPAVAKAAVVIEPDTIFDRIARAQENDMLTPDQAIDAQSLAQQYDAVQKGRLDAKVWKARLELAPAAVRGLYADMAA